MIAQTPPGTACFLFHAIRTGRRVKKHTMVKISDSLWRRLLTGWGSITTCWCFPSRSSLPLFGIVVAMSFTPGAVVSAIFAAFLNQRQQYYATGETNNVEKEECRIRDAV